MNDVRVKICGLTTPEDARVAGDLGADYLGMILSQGFKRSILPDRAVDIELAVDAPLVAVFVDEPLSEVERIGRMIGASVIQLHGEEGLDYVEELRGKGDWAIWKAIRVRDRATAIETVRAFGPSVDGVLLDGWQEGHPGGTGAQFSWDEMRIARVEIPGGGRSDRRGGLETGQCRRSSGSFGTRRRRCEFGSRTPNGAQGPRFDPVIHSECAGDRGSSPRVWTAAEHGR